VKWHTLILQHASKQGSQHQSTISTKIKRKHGINASYTSTSGDSLKMHTSSEETDCMVQFLAKNLEI